LQQLAFSKNPQQIVWAVRSDGTLLAMVYQREHQVLGWTRQVTDGQFESVAVIPGSDEDEIWFVVKRTINGQTKRYVERLTWFDEEDNLEDAFFVDSGLTYDGPPATVISGLSHLEGKTVAILANGAVHPNKIVTNGSITLNYPASKVQAGLPMTSRLKTMSPEIPGGKITTLQAVRRRIVEALLRLYRSRGGKIGPDSNHLDDLFYRRPEDVMNTNTLYTGDLIVNPRTHADWHGQLEVVCDQPLPFSLLMLVKRLLPGIT